MRENIKKIVKSPEEVLENVKKYFTKDRKFVFLLSFILGIITHFILLSNLIFSQDGLLNGIHYTAGNYEASLGRWGINIFDSIRNNIAFPFITTMISIIILGFVNILLIDLFEIKGKIFQILTIFALVVSPSLCMTLLYVYTADVYFYSLFFSVLTVYSMYKIKNKKIAFFIGMISFVLMLATYQSYMGVTVGLIVMLEIKNLLTDKSCLNTLIDLLKKLIILAVYVVIYYIITLLILKINNLTMSTYGGLNGIGIVSIFSSLNLSVKNAYLAFIKYFFADGVILNRTWNRHNLYIYFFIIYALIMLILFLKGIHKKGKKEFISKFIFACILIFILPIALNLVVIAAPGNEIYYLTSTQMTLIFPFVFIIVQLLDENEIFAKILKWGITIITIIILMTYFLSIIVTYETTELSYNQAKNIAERVVLRMEDCPGYHAGMKNLFAGIIDDVNFPKTMDIYNYTVANSLRASLFHATYWGHEATWRNFYNLFLGMNIEYCNDYEYFTIINSDEFKEMDIFPGKNSVKIINDIMVVKFTDNPENPPLSQTLLDYGIIIE